MIESTSTCCWVRTCALRSSAIVTRRASIRESASAADARTEPDSSTKLPTMSARPSEWWRRAITRKATALIDSSGSVNSEVTAPAPRSNDTAAIARQANWRTWRSRCERVAVR